MHPIRLSAALLLVLLAAGGALAGPDEGAQALEAGLAARAAGTHAEAAAAFERAERAFGESGDPRAKVARFYGLASKAAEAENGPEEAAMLINAGQAWLGAERAEEGVRVMRQGIALAAERGAVTWQGRGGAMLAQVLLGLGEHDAALAEAEKAMPSIEKAEDDVGGALATITMGKVHAHREELAAAIADFSRGLAFAQRAKFGAAILMAISHLAHAHYRFGDMQAARPYYVMELRITEQNKLDPTRIDICYTNLAWIHWELAEFDELEDLVRRGLARAAEAKRPALGAAMQTMQANMAVLQGRQREGIRIFKEAEGTFRELGDRKGVTDVHLGIGKAYDRLGRGDKGLRFLEQRLRELEGVEGADRDRARLHIQAAGIHLHLARYDQALDALDAGETAARAAQDASNANAVTSMRGTVYWALGDYERALALHQQALATAKALGNTGSTLVALGNVGVLQYELGDLEAALETTRRAVAIARTRDDLGPRMHHLRNLASLLHEAGRAEEAGARMAEAVELADAQGSPWERIEVHLGAARLLGDRGARIARLRELAEEAHSYRLQTFEVQARAELAKLQIDADPAEALREATAAARELEELLGGLGDAHGTHARRRYADVYQLGALAAARLDRPADAFRMLEQGRAGLLVGALRARDLIDWSALPDELQTAQAAARVDVARAQAKVATAARRQDLDARRKAGAALELALAQARDVADRVQRAVKKQADLAFPRVPPLREVQDTLLEDQAFVVFGLCRDEAIAVVVTPEDERIVALGSRAALEQAVAAVALDDPDQAVGPRLAALAKHVVEPLALAKEVREVIVSPDGALCQAPLGLVFGERRFAMTPSATTYAHLAEVGSAVRGEKVLAMGDPFYGKGATAAVASVYTRARGSSDARGGGALAPLPATRPEVEAVGDIVLLGKEATEGRFRAALPKQTRWRSVHFACHGLINPEAADLCALALTPDGADDGFLTSLELLQMQIPADLAVLSACETGRGQVSGGEGLLGLARSFIHAGAPRVVCSLWKVDDEATRAFMVRFYELWNPAEGEGLPPAEALRQAQAHVRAQPKWQHPYFWGAWTLWGLPR